MTHDEIWIDLEGEAPAASITRPDPMRPADPPPLGTPDPEAIRREAVERYHREQAWFRERALAERAREAREADIEFFAEVARRARPAQPSDEQLIEERYRWRRADEKARERLEAERAERTRLLSVVEPGGSAFDLPDDPVIWGRSEAPIAVEGQAWMICGPDGAGKTTDGTNYAKARIGLIGEVWGLPVAPLPEDRTVWYFAMDRPVQAKRALARGLDPEAHRAVLDERLLWQSGPPRLSLATEPGRDWLMAVVEEHRVGLVVFDSRKDLGPTENGDHVFEVAVTVQTLVAAGVDVLILHHPHQSRRNGPPGLEDVKGVRDVFSGLGSVVFLDAKPGAALVEAHHVKPVYEKFEPFVLQREHATGQAWPVGFVGDDDRMSDREARAAEWRDKALSVIGDEWTPAELIKKALGSGNLSRDLKPLIDEGLIKHNGRRSSDSAYMRVCKKKK